MAGCSKGILSSQYFVSDYKNPYAWFDGSDATTMLNASSTQVVDNDPVMQWNDKTGNGFNLTQTDPVYRPVYKASGINSKPAVLFNTNYIVNASLYPGSQYFTMLSVHVGDSGPVWGLAKNTNYECYFPNAGNTFYVPDAINSWTSGTGLNNSYAYVSAIRYKQTSSNTLKYIVYSTTGGLQVLKNEVLFSANFTFNGRFLLGARLPATAYYSGYIGEVLMYNRTLTDDEINTVILTLRLKWSI